MIRIENPRLREQILENLRWLYVDSARHENLHLTDLIYCLAPGTKVLTGDLLWVPISSLKVGDVLVGVEEEVPLVGRGISRKSLLTEVVASVPVCLPSYKIYLTGGRTVIASSNHLWLARPSDPGYSTNKDRVRWRRTDTLEVGSRIRQFSPFTWAYQHNYEAGYLAGFLDSEGSISRGGHAGKGLQLHFGQKPGIVLDTVLKIIDELGVKVSGKGMQSGVMSYCTTGLVETYHLLGLVRPGRLLEKFATLYGSGKDHRAIGLQQTESFAEVLAIEFVGEQDLISLETDAGTFIAEGLVSHNCLTKSYFDKVDPMPPTDEEVMLFAVGIGLQRILVPKAQEAQAVVVNGIICSPDFIAANGEWAELKTTRMSSTAKDKVTGQKSMKEFPDTWVEQMKGYCYAGIKPIDNEYHYDLAVLHLMGNYAPPFPEIVGWRVTFTAPEVEEFWYYILDRKVVLEGSLAKGIPPPPYMFCREWECKSCRYKMQCEIMKGGQEDVVEEVQ